ncbi:MAG: tRNA (guanosine(37)-N1)-methyltransferase TrmD [Gammaproteobacteria bacterium]|jgi:tRNA (guanine37-N1)-methyltransferase|nr:tRNA (guanosine(37)-N1)-methyltransferase TrmD [Gammaproteobacteria bacterium]MDH3971916.1 tRNA (guanosine(37)-N1)-methyltransferase TrmD [Gammaproteobacteria bacterium]MDH3986829.1 tRNA (guanosine(37)-N1)-methyltransferase TrmD [Gammaproteobacteria bacterium]
MRIDVITLFPEMVRECASHGIQGRAIDRGLLQLQTWNPRDYTEDKHRGVDDRPYGGGPGMVMQVQPLRAAVRAARQADASAPVIYLSPQGQRFDQGKAQQLAGLERMILVSGRYEGVDERFIDLEVDQELSAGDYVLSGGELPALMVMDAVTRLLPGALGDADSAQQDSFMEGLLDYPHYTRPEEIDGLQVPAELIGGNHADIRRWRTRQALGRTWQRRPDLLELLQLDEQQQGLLNEFINEYESGN